MPLAVDGQTIEPSVSVPMATAQRFAATARPGAGARAAGVAVEHVRVPRLPAARAPAAAWSASERMFAHSLRLVLPRSTAPASRSARATNESRGGIEPRRASEPAVVVIWSAVSTLSLTSTGMPCSGPRGPFVLALRVERLGDGERVGVRLDDAAERGPAAIEGLDAGEVGLRSAPASVSVPAAHPVLKASERRLLELESRARLGSQSRPEHREGPGPAAHTQEVTSFHETPRPSGEWRTPAAESRASSRPSPKGRHVNPGRNPEEQPRGLTGARPFLTIPTGLRLWHASWMFARS